MVNKFGCKNLYSLKWYFSLKYNEKFGLLEKKQM